jgi:hypothetical protein
MEVRHSTYIRRELRLVVSSAELKLTVARMIQFWKDDDGCEIGFENEKQNYVLVAN